MVVAYFMPCKGIKEPDKKVEQGEESITSTGHFLVYATDLEE